MRHRRNKPDRSTTVAGRLLAITLSVGLLTGTVATAKAATSKPSGSDANATAALEGAKDTGSADPGANKQSSGIASSNATSPDPSTKPTTPSAPTATPGTSETPSTTPTPQNSEQPTPSSDPAPTPTPTQSDPKDSYKAADNSLKTITYTDPKGRTTPVKSSLGDRTRFPNPDPFHKGYSFLGWFNGNVAYDFNQPVTEDLTLTAHWAEGSDSWSLSPSHGPTVGNTAATITPPVVGDIRFSQQSSGRDFSLAIDSNGKLYSWGDNSKGQLGRDPTASAPANRPGRVNLPDDVYIAQASAGPDFSIAIDRTGALYTWGNNSNGQLGRTLEGLSTAEPAEVGIPDKSLKVGFVQVSAGQSHVLALTENGRIYSWGDNSKGQLGRSPVESDNSITRHDIPSTIEMGQINKATQVAAGGNTSLAVGADGNIYSWGDNSSGQLGRDTGGQTANQPAKANMPDSVTYTKGVSAGYRHSMAICSDGYLYGWGDNSSGQLGNSTTSNVPITTPGKADFPEELKLVSVKTDGAPITDVTRNQDGTWSFRTPAHKNGQVDVTVEWTRNGQQPDAHLVYKYDGSKYTVTFDSTGGTSTPDAQQVLDGDQASRPDKDPAKDGYLFDGWFLKDSKGDSNIAYDFNQPVTSDITIVAHWSPVSHWTIDKKEGAETGGQNVKLTPSQGTRGIRFSRIQSGRDFNLAFGSDGNLYSWGNAGDYQTGHPGSNIGLVDTPTGVRYTQAVAGGNFALALGSDGNVYSWGNNAHGQLGRFTVPGQTHPQKIEQPAGIRYTRIYAGSDFALALASDGNLYAWGDNQFGILGPAANVLASYNSIPSRIILEGITFTKVFTGSTSSHVLALGSDGNLYGWGNSSDYQVRGKKSALSRPVKVEAPAGVTFTQASAGENFSLALDSDGNLYSWGNNKKDQSGNLLESWGIKQPYVTSPMKVTMPSGIHFTQFVSGGQYGLAAGSDGNIYSWGLNDYGQLGRSTTDKSHYLPTKVDAPEGITLDQPQAGENHSLAIGSDGNTYSWGDDQYNQLGRERPTSDKLDPHPGKVNFPGVGIPRLVQFGNAAGTNLTNNNDGTWNVTTPPYSPGPVTVTIDWTVNGVTQTPDTSNVYRYTSIGVLPRAGGTGIFLPLAIGVIIIATTIAARRLRQTRSLNR